MRPVKFHVLEMGKIESGLAGSVVETGPLPQAVNRAVQSASSSAIGGGTGR
jgi:hypothetical protein